MSSLATRVLPIFTTLALLAPANTLRAQSTVRIDGSTAKSFQTSVNKMAASLKGEERRLFEQTVGVMSLFTPAKDLRKRLHRSSAKKVLAAGKSMMKELDQNRDGKLDKKEIEQIRTMLVAARKNANESAAIATLRNLSSAQAQVQAMGVIDTNNNGIGEYGFFAEMAGFAALRTSKGLGKHRIKPPVLSRSFRVTNGRVQRIGYIYQVWLPGTDGTAMAEANHGGVDTSRKPGAKHAERQWVCYAWPVKNGETGTRIFAIDQAGDVMVSDNTVQKYSGTQNAPSPYAARQRGTKTLTGTMAKKVKGPRNDRGTWRRLSETARPRPLGR